MRERAQSGASRRGDILRSARQAGGPAGTREGAPAGEGLRAGLRLGTARGWGRQAANCAPSPRPAQAGTPTAPGDAWKAPGARAPRGGRGGRAAGRREGSLAPGRGARGAGGARREGGLRLSEWERSAGAFSGRLLSEPLPGAGFCNQASPGSGCCRSGLAR